MLNANVEATSMCFGGFRATITEGERVVSSQHFATKGWGKFHVDECYRTMKEWLAGFGVS